MSYVPRIRTGPAVLCAVLSLLAIAGYYALPFGQDVLYDGLGVACSAMFLNRARSGGRARSAWLLAAIGILLWSVGDVLASLVIGADARVGSVSATDALYLLGYPFLAASQVSFGRLRGSASERGLFLEGSMLMIAAALPAWEFWISPALVGSSAGTSETVITLAYPVMDLMLIAAGMRLALGSANWTFSGALLTVGLGIVVAGDALYNVQVLKDTYVSGGLLDASWMFAYAIWAVAAVHPSAGGLPQSRVRSETFFMQRRLVVLALLFASPLLVIATAYGQGHRIDVWPVLGTLFAITAVLVFRLRSMARSQTVGWRTHGVVAGCGFVLVLLAAALASSRSADLHRTNAVLRLAESRGMLERLSGTEANAHAGQWNLPDVSQRFSATFIQLQRTLPDEASLLDQRSAKRLRDDLDFYHRQVRQEFNYLAAGDRKDAVVFDRDSVGPAFVALSGDLDRTVSRYHQRVAAQAREERIGTMIALLIAALIITLLIRRFGAARREAARVEERAHAVAESEQQIQALISGSTDILTVIDAQRRIVRHPETVERMLGHPPGSMLGTQIDSLLNTYDLERTVDMLVRLTGTPDASDTIDWTLHHVDGTELTVEARIVNHLGDPRLGGFVLNVRDVTARRDLEGELAYRAFHDHLTGLGNRALLEDRLRHALHRSARTLAVHAVVVIDLDDFKSVNDSLGHGAGDELLVEAARRFGLGLRPNDTLARVGGDEFAVLLEDVGSEHDAVSTARRLLQRLRDPFELAGHTVVVGGSAGVSVTDGGGSADGEEALRELRNADLAMYEAKQNGGGTVELFAPALHEAVATRIELRSDIRRGLEHGEFTIYYQPIMDIETETTVGFEALMRWISPTRGFVSPADFIPVAEQSGLILDLGRFVLDESIRQMETWNRAGIGKGLYVSVNVSGAQIEREEFEQEVADALRGADIEPSQLLLELTESGLIRDSSGNERRIRALRELGVRLAIDDFGTGYSSLSYLQRFHFDVLKIDKSFIDPMATGQGSPLVKAIITMGRDLGLSVIAEGIETTEQAIALRERGCELGQGYLFSRPLPPAELPEELFRAAPSAAQRP